MAALSMWYHPCAEMVMDKAMIEKDYEVEVVLTVRVKATGMHAAKRVAKAIVPQVASGATLDGFGEVTPGAKVASARQVR